MRILIYDPKTGQPLREVSCPCPKTAEAQVQEGEAWIEIGEGFEVDYEAHRVKRGKLVHEPRALVSTDGRTALLLGEVNVLSERIRHWLAERGNTPEAFALIIAAMHKGGLELLLEKEEGNA